MFTEEELECGNFDITDNEEKYERRKKMSDKKYLNVGSVVEFEGRQSVQLDNGSLRELVEFIQEHGKKYLQGLDLEGIRAGQKLKKDEEGHIPRLRLYFFEPNEKAPAFIKQNVSIKVK